MLLERYAGQGTNFRIAVEMIGSNAQSAEGSPLFSALVGHSSGVSARFPPSATVLSCAQPDALSST